MKIIYMIYHDTLRIHMCVCVSLSLSLVRVRVQLLTYPNSEFG